MSAPGDAAPKVPGIARPGHRATRLAGAPVALPILRTRVSGAARWPHARAAQGCSHCVTAPRAPPTPLSIRADGLSELLEPGDDLVADSVDVGKRESLRLVLVASCDRLRDELMISEDLLGVAIGYGVPPQVNSYDLEH